MTTRHRPYFSLSAPDILTEVQSKYWDDLVVLNEAYDELFYRWEKSIRKRPSKTPPAEEVLRTILARINLLLNLDREYFPWPDPDAESNAQTFFNGIRSVRPSIGPLKFFGYGTGRANQLPEQSRQKILDRIFLKHFPPDMDCPSEYLQLWAQPNSKPRLSMLAFSLCRFIRQAKGRQKKLDHDMDVAIHEWKQDLAYLKSNHYEGRFDKEPSTLR